MSRDRFFDRQTKGMRSFNKKRASCGFFLGQLVWMQPPQKPKEWPRFLFISVDLMGFPSQKQLGWVEVAMFFWSPALIRSPRIVQSNEPSTNL
jgi:hypothetical protein